MLDRFRRDDDFYRPERVGMIVALVFSVSCIAALVSFVDLKYDGGKVFMILMMGWLNIGIVLVLLNFSKIVDNVPDPYRMVAGTWGAMAGHVGINIFIPCLLIWGGF
jgi:hypothetical protein